MTSDKAQWPTEPQGFAWENFCLEIGTLCLPSQAAAPSLIMGKNRPTWATDRRGQTKLGCRGLVVPTKGILEGM